MKDNLGYISVIMHSRKFGDNLLVFSDTYRENQFNYQNLKYNINLLIPNPVISKSDVPSSPVKCKWADCGKTFSYLDDLATHVSTFHSNSGPGGLFYCRWDGCSRGEKGFNARYKMLVHVRTHTNEKPHQCFQCQKSFSRAENLKIHARSHTGERPYVCPVPGCGKAYSNSSDRFKHTRTHSVHKPYVCKVLGCGKRYTDPSSLRKHVKTYRHFAASYSNAGVAATGEHDENSPRSRTVLNDARVKVTAGERRDEPTECQEVPQLLSDDRSDSTDRTQSLDSFPARGPYDFENATSLSYAVLKKWLKSESVLKTFASAAPPETAFYFKEQDFPLDLTVRK